MAFPHPLGAACNLGVGLAAVVWLASACAGPAQVAEPPKAEAAEVQAPKPKETPRVKRMDFKDAEMTGGCTLSIYWFDGDRYGIVHVPSLCPKCKPRFD